MLRKCNKCNKEFRTLPSIVKRGRGKYCSHTCSNSVTASKTFLSKYTKEHGAWNKGIHTGLIPSTAFKKGINFSRENHPMFGKKHTQEHRLNISKSLRGEKSYRWQGGITSIHQAIRNSFEYEEWRKQVFERDLYTCQHCGQVGGYLEADHIKPFAYYPELRLELSNGRTLCKPCHKKTDTYMGRARWLYESKEALDERGKQK